MGLDMYLLKRNRNTDEKWSDVGYWRKANQIRQWFADTLGDEFIDNGINPITKHDLESLSETCKKVLDNHRLARVLLPTSSGFFFGSTDYDDWYYEDLEDTVRMVDEVLNTTDFDTEEVAYYEWY